MKKVSLYLFLTLLPLSCIAQNGYIHGNGDPSTLTPVPNCASSRFYIDDSTGKLYTAAQGSPCVWSYSGSVGTAVTASAIGNLYGFGDSLVVGAYSPSASVSLFGLLARDYLGPSMDFGVSGTLQASITNSLLANMPPVFPNNPPPTIFEDGGVNDGNTLGATTGTLNNYSLQLDASIYWPEIPVADRFMASTATATGFAASYTGPGLNVGTVGSAKQSTTQGDTLTFSGTAVGSKVGINYAAFLSSGGTFTVGLSVNGGASTLQTDICSGTTTFSNSGCNGAAVSVTTAFRQEFSITPGAPFTLVVTVTSATSASNPVAIIAADTIPSSSVGLPAFIQSGVLRQLNDALSTTTAAFNNAAAAVVQQAKTDNLNLIFADVRTGSPGVNTSTDMATSTTACPALTGNTPLHPNQCGYLDYAQTVENSAPTLFHPGQGSKASVFYGPLSIYTAYGSTVFSALTNVNTNAVAPTAAQWGGGIMDWNPNLGNIVVHGMVWDSVHSAAIAGIATTLPIALQHCSGSNSPSQCSNALYLDSAGDGQFLGSMQLGSTVAGTCSAALAGQFQYTQGNATTKDVVEVCAHDASNVYAWRAIY